MSLHEAIHSRHSKDLVVGECKDGPTWGGGHQRLDYWVLRRSWTNPAMIGYEVKMARSDWLKDSKWQGYLPLCNELWFIAPTAVILPGELPDGVGHLRLAGSRLITVRRAAWREIEPPVTLLTYILMCRASIDAPKKSNQADYWAAWLAEKEEDRQIGWQASEAIRAKYRRDVTNVRSENDRLRTENEGLAALRDALAARGVRWNRWTKADEVAAELSVPKWDREQVRAAHTTLGKLLNGGSE